MIDIYRGDSDVGVIIEIEEDGEDDDVGGGVVGGKLDVEVGDKGEDDGINIDVDGIDDIGILVGESLVDD